MQGIGRGEAGGAMTEITKSITLDADSETKSYNLFTVTGICKITKLYGEITTVASSDVSACFCDLYDGSVNVDITESMSGADISGLPAGSLLIRELDAVSPFSVKDGTDNYISEESSTTYKVFAPLAVGQKGDGTTTNIRFTYTTFDSPSSGAIKFYIEYEAMSDDGAIAAA